MELNKENMRKIRELILFTALLIVVLWKYEEVLEDTGICGTSDFSISAWRSHCVCTECTDELYRAALVYEKSKKK